MAEKDRFAELLSEVARDVTRRQTSEVCCGTLTLEQYRTLQAISRADQASIGSLSTALGVDLSTMSRNTSVLERDGYITRARSENDGRVVHVKLLAKGRRALETLRCSERDLLSDVYQGLSASERPKVMKALEALRECLGRKVADAEPCCSPAPAGKNAS
ncbi:MAG TPA: MarR family winged helix-turn-helix transcriptional regulator [Polyangia bacterium]|jgi:DNA-binding MarR family transcriptional regulator|nr:MarR family winged helix-turn-helix transcriptional regulator [Polyangia bacterium]